jgi:hypothetical protein
MRRLCYGLLWTLVFLLLLVGIDQLLVRVPATHPAHVAVASFYRDLRARLLDLAKGGAAAPAPVRPVKRAPPAPARGGPPAGIEGIIESHQAGQAKSPAPPSARAQAGDAAPRYLYADDQGELHFAETLAEIPEPFRARARVLGE